RGTPRPKQLNVNRIRIENDLFTRDTARFEVPLLHLRHDKNTRGGFKVQSFVPLQQLQTSHAVPMLSDPHLRPVVLEKQRPARARRRGNSGPTEARVALV